MLKCKDCVYWEQPDVKNTKAWGDCNYYVTNKIVAPIWMNFYLDKLPHDRKGFTSPEQEHCKILFERIK